MRSERSDDDGATGAPEALRWWFRRGWRIAAKLLLTVAVLYLSWRFAARVGWAEVAARLSASSPAWVALAVALLLGRFAALHHRWQLALERLGPPPGHSTRFFVLLSAVFLNHVTPTARILGGIFRARYLARDGRRSFAALYGTVLADVVSNQFAIWLMTWLSIIVLAWRIGRPALAWVAGLLLVGLAIGLGRWLGSRRSSDRREPLERRLRRWAARRDDRHDALVEGGQETLGTALEILSDGRLQLHMALWGAVAFLVNAAAQWVLFLAIGAPIDPVLVTVTVALGTGVGVLTGVPGGLGATEAAMIAGYVALGVGEADATAATLLYRGLHYALVMVTGLPALLWFELVSDLRPGAAGAAARGSEDEPGAGRESP